MHKCCFLWVVHVWPSYMCLTYWTTKLNQVRIKGTAPTGCTCIETAASFVSLTLRWLNLPGGSRRGLRAALRQPPCFNAPCSVSSKPSSPALLSQLALAALGMWAACAQMDDGSAPFSFREQGGRKSVSKPQLSQDSHTRRFTGLNFLGGCLFPKLKSCWKEARSVHGVF